MNSIDEIMAQTSQKKKKGSSGSQHAFFGIETEENFQENFLEIRFNSGVTACFSYSQLDWFNYDPDSGIDLTFGDIMVTIIGRGLYPKLFAALKSKRCSWIKEADSQMQDSDDHSCYVQEILITPPPEFDDDSDTSVSDES